MAVQILIPLYNDWDALRLLLGKIEEMARSRTETFKVTVVNDCSKLPFDATDFKAFSLDVLHLMRNVGHQKAIAIGLSYLAHQEGIDKVIVMDSDGEDKPEAIPELLEKSYADPQKIIFAHRSKRSEGFIFRTFYKVYKFIFVLLTGQQISFGNFSLIPNNFLKKVAFLHEIWNNYPGGVIRSKLPFDSIPIERGHRLAGKSKMNFISLVLHGMSTISVFLDTTAVRIMLASMAMITLAVVGIIGVLSLKLIVHHATPGWASSLASMFFLIVLQAFFISLFLVFTVLSYRSSRHFIPLLEYHDFIETIEKVNS